MSAIASSFTGLPRGIPAASLKQAFARSRAYPAGKSSAGNTRGLIEARKESSSVHAVTRLPRGIPAASLKHAVREHPRATRRGLPRGIPAASLKQVGGKEGGDEYERLPRGIPAASLKPSPSLTAAVLSNAESATYSVQKRSSGTTNLRKPGNGSVRWLSCGRLPVAGRRRARRRWPAVRVRPAWRCARAGCARRGAGRWR